MSLRQSTQGPNNQDMIIHDYEQLHDLAIQVKEGLMDTNICWSFKILIEKTHLHQHTP